MNIDPTKTDMWVMPVMGNGWHLWQAGHPESACKLPWDVASQAWNAQTERPPPVDCCSVCNAVSEDAQ